MDGHGDDVAALEQRTADWKRDLRSDVRIARLVLRRLLNPITLHDESTRPEFVRSQAEPNAISELLRYLEYPREPAD